MISHLRRAWKQSAATSTKRDLRLDRPIILFQSDDWGRVGVRDREGWDELQQAGIHLGESPYDFYSLETAHDLHALRTVLKKHRDSAGRNPSIGMNFITANIDFDRCLHTSENKISLLPLADGLPRQWQRPHLFEAYQQGTEDGVFLPALHALTHFCEKAILRELKANGEHAELIRKLWRAQTPYIYWRMPWVGYEYWDPEMTREHRFLSLEEQRSSICQAAEIFQKLFPAAPLSACAPGYRANDDTRTAWFEAGIRVVQNGPAKNKAPHLDARGMLHTFRTVELEPATSKCHLVELTNTVEECFRIGVPAVVSIHSINFHSSLRDFRTPTLLLLDHFLDLLEQKWPNLLYLNDADLFRIATEGFYLANGKKIDVDVTTMAGRNQP